MLSSNNLKSFKQIKQKTPEISHFHFFIVEALHLWRHICKWKWGWKPTKWQCPTFPNSWLWNGISREPFDAVRSMMAHFFFIFHITFLTGVSLKLKNFENVKSINKSKCFIFIIFYKMCLTMEFLTDFCLKWVLPIWSNQSLSWRLNFKSIWSSMSLSGGHKGDVEFDVKNRNSSIVFCIWSLSVLTLHVCCLINLTTHALFKKFQKLNNFFFSIC